MGQLYTFTNRRRAKDAIMHVADTCGTDEVFVFVREGLVYVHFYDVPVDILTIMHYAQLCTVGVENFLRLDEVEEYYRGDGVRKFRV